MLEMFSVSVRIILLKPSIDFEGDAYLTTLAVPRLGYIASNGMMTVDDEIKKDLEGNDDQIWVQSRYLARGTKENYERPQSGEPVSRSRFEPNTSEHES